MVSSGAPTIAMRKQTCANAMPTCVSGWPMTDLVLPVDGSAAPEPLAKVRV
jgi:hypothetical protein